MKEILILEKIIKITIENNSISFIKSFFKKNNIKVLDIKLNFSSQNKIIIEKKEEELLIRFMENIKKIKGIKNVFHNAVI